MRFWPRLPKKTEPHLSSLIYGLNLFVDAQEGDDKADGLSWDTALLTMKEALSRVTQGSVINLYGKLVEDGLVTPQGATDVTVIGRAPTPRSGSTGRTRGPKGGAANWRISRDDVDNKPLLLVTQQGWAFRNIHFHGPKRAACLHFIRNVAGEEKPTGFAGDHVRIDNCVFDGPGFGVIQEGGIIHVKITDSLFVSYGTQGNFAISGSNTSVGDPTQWEISGNQFMGNFGDIKIGLTDSKILGNYFQGRSSVSGIELANNTAIDLRNGYNNLVANNWMGAVRSRDNSRFCAGVNDSWGPNFYMDGAYYGLP